MTLLARHSCLYVALVVELCVVREYVDFYPWNRLALVVVFLDFSDLFCGLFVLAFIDQPMAPHTGLDLGDGRVGRLRNRPVAVLTFYFVVCNVRNVTEFNRLLRTVPFEPLLRSEVPKVVSNIEVPEGSLPVIENALINANLFVFSRWGSVRDRILRISFRHNACW